MQGWRLPPSDRFPSKGKTQDRAWLSILWSRTELQHERVYSTLSKRSALPCVMASFGASIECLETSKRNGSIIKWSFFCASQIWKSIGFMISWGRGEASNKNNCHFEIFLSPRSLAQRTANISDATEMNVLSILIKFSENPSPIIKKPVFTDCYLRLYKTFLRIRCDFDPLLLIGKRMLHIWKGSWSEECLWRQA